jgi:glycosyltransferase involved in cell wall biosynthesis
MIFSEMQDSQKPLVSVIIPTDNSAHYLAESIESVLGQSFRDFELIVVDDGSTDNTEAVIAPFKGLLRYFKKANGGPSGARNDQTAIKEMLILSTKYMLLVALPVAAVFFVLGDLFIGLWMGPEYTASSLILSILTIAV